MITIAMRVETATILERVTLRIVKETLNPPPYAPLPPPTPFLPRPPILMWQHLQEFFGVFFPDPDLSPKLASLHPPAAATLMSLRSETDLFSALGPIYPKPGPSWLLLLIIIIIIVEITIRIIKTILIIIAIMIILIIPVRRLKTHQKRLLAFLCRLLFHPRPLLSRRSSLRWVERIESSWCRCPWPLAARAASYGSCWV
mmetsp:Transcript_6998/g.13767  ORF Transcript_6998/g.13767 Transcript_6998/m.13767 type:complete len:200 (-) Transcript_6998:330-929(-)